jgi:hypothetical protein
MRLNAILIGLQAPEAAAVIKSGRLVELSVRDQIYEPDEPINDVFFPIDCVLSVVTRMKNGHAIEVGTSDARESRRCLYFLGLRRLPTSATVKFPESQSR